jgi:hypothetical protein
MHYVKDAGEHIVVNIFKDHMILISVLNINNFLSLKMNLCSDIILLCIRDYPIRILRKSIRYIPPPRLKDCMMIGW